MQASALLVVFMDVGTEVTEEEFHGMPLHQECRAYSYCRLANSDWFTNEHIPLRTQRLATFLSAARYRAIDGIVPKYVAMYTVSDLAAFSDPAYTSLRELRSEREADIMNRLPIVDRRVRVSSFYIVHPPLGVSDVTYDISDNMRHN